MSRLYVLRGNHPKLGFVEQYFTAGEHETAVAVAKTWLARGWKPSLHDTDLRAYVSYQKGKRAA